MPSTISPYYFNGGGNYLAPGDIATIYDIGPLYTAGIDGTGMKIAIMGQTDIYAVGHCSIPIWFWSIGKRPSTDTCHRLLPTRVLRAI